MGCEKFQITPGIFSSSRSMAAISSSLFWWKTGRHLLLGLQVDEVFGVEEAGGVGAVVGTADLADDLVTSGKEASMTRAWFITRDAFGRAGAGRERAAHPDGAFVEMGQKLGADDAAERQEDGETPSASAATPTVTQRCSNGPASAACDSGR